MIRWAPSSARKVPMALPAVRVYGIESLLVIDPMVSRVDVALLVM
jgi:hypothetical protein